MKKIGKILLPLICLVYFSQPLSAHKEWVHQYIIYQAYQLLKNQYGRVLELEQEIATWLTTDNGILGRGDAQRPWDHAPAITIGVYREDVFDAVGRVSISGSTHFWKSDVGENSISNIGYDPFIYPYINAWEKARIYMNGSSSISKGTTPHKPRSYISIEGDYQTDFLGGNIAKRISYNNLIDLYKNGNYWYHGGEAGLNGGATSLINPPYYNYNGPLNQITRKRYAYNLLGRIAHLLGDMSVPAHTHEDPHACDWPLSDGDSYELWAGKNDFTDPGGCNDLHTDPRVADIDSFGNAIYADWQTALQQGINEGKVFLLPETELSNSSTLEQDYDILRYLFYTTNQITNFFPSYNAQGSLQKWGNMTLDDGLIYDPITDTWIQLFPNNYPRENLFLKSKLIQLYNNSDPSNWYKDLDRTKIAKETLNYCIRATATLLFWFVKRVGLPNYIQPYAVTVDGESDLASGRCATYTAYRSGEGSGLPATIQWQMRREINGELPGTWQDIGTGPTASVCMDGSSDKIRVRARSTIISTGVTATGTFLVENYTIKREGRPVVLAADVSKSVSITTPKLGSSITNLARKYQNDLKPTTDSTVFYYTNTFGYTLPATSKVTIEVLNNQYRKVASWNETIEKPAMQYTHTWNASTMPEGAYLVRIVAVEAQTGIYHRSYLPIYIKRTATPPWIED